MLKLFLNIQLAWTGPPAQLALKALLNAAKSLSLVRVNFKCRKEIGQTQLVSHKIQSSYKVP